MIPTAALRNEVAEAAQKPLRKIHKVKLALPRIIAHPPIRDAERADYTRRRVAKAERDERMDITKMLTPVKTCVPVPILVWCVWSLMLGSAGTWAASPDRRTSGRRTGSPAVRTSTRRKCTSPKGGNGRLKMRSWSVPTGPLPLNQIHILRHSFA